MYDIVGAILVFAVLWIFGPLIKNYILGVSDEVKVNVAESAVERAPRIIAVNDSLNKLGEIPDIDDIISKARGKKPKDKQPPEVITVQHS